MLHEAAVFLPAGSARGGHRPQGQAPGRGRGTTAHTHAKQNKKEATRGSASERWMALHSPPNPLPRLSLIHI
eukprot:10859939-Alexandrium_andersonii.AAC.1